MPVHSVMTTNLNLTLAPVSETPRAGRPVSVLVIYENIPARIRIQQCCWMLMRELSREFNFECSWYGFDDLKHPRVAMRARAAAANADVILFSVSVDTELPPAVRTWVESWIRYKTDQDTALAALLNKPNSARKRSSIWEYLSEIARRAGMSFLPEIVPPRHLCARAA